MSQLEENKIIGETRVSIRHQAEPSSLDKLREIKDTTTELQANGSFYLFDEADLFHNGQISAELQAAVDQLTDHGVRVVIFTSENPNRLSTDELIKQFLTANGFSADGENIGMNDLICTINLNNLEGKKDFDCLAGFALSRNIGDAEINAVIDAIIDQGYYVSDPETGKSDYDHGFTVAYEGVDQILDRADAQATQQAMPVEQATEAPYQIPNDTQNFETQVVEQRPNFIETHQTETVSAAAVAIVAALWGIDFKFFRPKKMVIANANKERRNALGQITKLNVNVGRGISLFNGVADVYGASYPDEAKTTREQETDFRNRIDRLQEAKEELFTLNTSFFQNLGWAKNDKVTDEIRRKARSIQTETAELLALIQEKSDLFDSLNEQKAKSGSNVDKVKMEIEELEAWYDEKISVPSYRSILPPRKTAFTEMSSRYEEAFHNVRMNPQFELKGSKQAVELSEILLKFKVAVETFTSSYETSLALYADARKDLAKWPDRAITIEQLGNSGSKLLNDAKPGISIPNEFDEVIELSNQAKNEFIFAKDFASLTANVLTLQDENDKSIAEIEAEGFDDKHIALFREEMTEALTRANSLATLGKWKEAQAQLGILRVKTNGALEEMQRLQKLREQNINDLENLAKDVDVGKVKYKNETTKAWEDLQSFSSANYDETQAIWSELRSKNAQTESKVEVTDLRFHFGNIALILEEITDNQSSETDIASQVASKNSFKKQKFDEAAILIREMEKKLARADQMMDELIERQKLINKAKKEHVAAIENAKTRLKSALESIDEPEEKRFTNGEIKNMIEESAKLIELAKKAGVAMVFVAALEAANRAADLAIQGKKNADDQIKEIRTLFSRLESRKKQSNLKANQIIERVVEEADAVITNETTKLVTNLKQALGVLVTIEAGLAAKENIELNRGLNDLLAKFDGLDAKTNELERSYNSDRESYSELLEDLKSAIRNAKSRIDSAEDHCNDSDAGIAGDGALSSATSTLPSMAEWGDSRSDIESRIKAAGKAKDYAETAYTQADRAIKAAEAARRAEQERLEKIAEDKRKAEVEKQRAIERAADERRQSEARKAVGNNQSHGRRSV